MSNGGLYVPSSNELLSRFDYEVIELTGGRYATVNQAQSTSVRDASSDRPYNVHRKSHDERECSEKLLNQTKLSTAVQDPGGV